MSSTTCVEVGDGGRERRTTDGGTTWTDVATGFNKALTKVACPSSSICYAAGDRGTVLKSTDGGQTWSYLLEHRRHPALRALLPVHDRLLRDGHLRAHRQDHRRRRRPGRGSRRRSRRRASTCRSPAGRTRSPACSRSRARAPPLRRFRPLRDGVRPDAPEHRPADRHDFRRRQPRGRCGRATRARATICTRSRVSRARRPATRSGAAARSSRRPTSPPGRR